MLAIFLFIFLFFVRNTYCLPFFSTRTNHNNNISDICISAILVVVCSKFMKMMKKNRFVKKVKSSSLKICISHLYLYEMSLLLFSADLSLFVCYKPLKFISNILNIYWCNISFTFLFPLMTKENKKKCTQRRKENGKKGENVDAMPNGTSEENVWVHFSAIILFFEFSYCIGYNRFFVCKQTLTQSSWVV